VKIKLRGGNLIPWGWKRIGFERKSVFKARPHPDLLHLEKGQREGVLGFTERLSD
jgi:hypothetical protein